MSEIQTTGFALRQALSTVPGMGLDTEKAYSTFALIQKKDEGFLNLSLMNGKGMELTVPFQGSATGSICIEAPKLNALMTDLQDNIKINHSRDKAKLSFRRSKYSLNCMKSMEFPSFANPSKDTKRITVNAKLFHQAFCRIRHIQPDNDFRHYLNGTLLKVVSDQLFLVATDGHRLGLQKVNIGNQEAIEDVIVPKKAFTPLEKLLSSAGKEDALEICVDNQKIFFYLNESRFSTVLIDAEYPDFEKVIPKGNHQTIIINRLDLLSVLRRCKNAADFVIFKRSGNSELTIQIKDQKTKVIIGEEVLDASTLDLDDKCYSWNSAYLQQSLDIQDETNVILKLGQPDTAMQMPICDGHEVLMPVRQ